MIEEWEPTCKEGCKKYPDWTTCPQNIKPNDEIHHHELLCQELMDIMDDVCPIQNELSKKRIEKRIQQNEYRLMTCPNCKSKNSTIVFSVVVGEVIIGGCCNSKRLRQCKDCKTVWTEEP